jgi:hypothetical protein
MPDDSLDNKGIKLRSMTANFAGDSYYQIVDVYLRDLSDLFEQLDFPITNQYWRLQFNIANNSDEPAFVVPSGTPYPDHELSVLLSGSGAAGGAKVRLYYEKVHLQQPEIDRFNSIVSSDVGFVKTVPYLAYTLGTTFTTAATASVSAGDQIDAAISPGVSSVRRVWCMPYIFNARVGSTVGESAFLSKNSAGLVCGALRDLQFRVDNTNIYSVQLRSDAEIYRIVREQFLDDGTGDVGSILPFEEWRARFRILCFDLQRNPTRFDPTKKVTLDMSAVYASSVTTDLDTRAFCRNLCRLDIRFIIETAQVAAFNMKTAITVSSN